MNLSFLAAARECPDRTAVVHARGVHTFADFAPFVRGAILHFESRGILPGAFVLLTASPRLETLAHIYALMELGIPFVPLHEKLSPRERAAIIQACAPAVVLEDPLAATREDGPVAGERAAIEHTTGGRTTDERTARARPPGRSPLIPNDSRPLAIVFTSGTTGRPKGVVLSRAAFVASAEASAANLGWREDDLWAIVLPLAHVGGLSIVTRSLLARRPIFLADRFEASALARALAEQRITLLSLVPAMVRSLLDHDPAWQPPGSLRAVLVGGGPLSDALLHEAIARGLPIVPSYGLTETCSQIAAWPYGTKPTAPVARPLKGAEIRIRDGRIQVRGPMLLASYFPPGAHPPPLDERGWFDTADRGRIDEDGFLHMLGRADEILVTGGENVSPSEVETEVERFHGVRAACVFGVREDPWGDVIAAAIVLEPSAAFDQDAFTAHLGLALAPHKRPRRIAILPSLPLASTGKVDRAAVRALASPLLVPIRR